MAIKTITAKFTGLKPLLMNNPQTVDRFNKYNRRMAEINAKKTRRTDDDYHELADLEMASKVYWDDKDGVVIPTRWVSAAMAKVSNKVAKIPKADIRASVFMVKDEAVLDYQHDNKVVKKEDVIHNEVFRHKMLLPQGQVRIAKYFPIFHNWAFQCDIEYDTTVLDQKDMERILEHASMRGGFGDFRPTFGRATVEFSHE